MRPSSRIYHFLLKLYPRGHREAFGEPMQTHFNDQLRDAEGKLALLGLWMRTIIDLVKTVPSEHAEVAHPEPAYPWHQVILAILPGALLFIPVAAGDEVKRLITLSVGGFYLLAALVLLARKKRAGWTLPILGMAGTFALFWASFFLLPLLGLGQYLGSGLPWVLPALLLLLLLLMRRGQRASWLLFGLLLATMLVAGLHEALAEGRLFSWHLDAPAWLLLGTVCGLPFARRYGTLAALFVTGAAYWGIETSINPGYGLSFSRWQALLPLLNGLTALVLSPLPALRARSRLGRALALIAPLAGYLLLLAVLPAFLSDYGWATTVPRVLNALQIISVTIFALALYHDLSPTRIATTVQSRR